MENELQTETIFITNIEIKEKKRKDGTTWKDLSVSVKNPKKGIYYTLPIKKADGTPTKAFEFYKLYKPSWDSAFMEDRSIPVDIMYSEKESVWKTKEGVEMTSYYRTIRMMQATEEDENILADIPM